MQGYFPPILFRPFILVKEFAQTQLSKRNISELFQFTQFWILFTDNKSRRGENKTGANSSLYTVFFAAVGPSVCLSFHFAVIISAKVANTCIEMKFDIQIFQFLVSGHYLCKVWYSKTRL